MQLILLLLMILTLSFRTLRKLVKPVFLFLLLGLSSHLIAQHRCGSKPHSHSDIFESWMARKLRNPIQKSQASGTNAVIYEIPIVVHIHEPASGGSHNISDERVFRQIEILNEDFRRTNADAANTPDTFLPVAADTEIQFVLARQDPYGNPTNGIVRLRGTKNQYNSRNDQDLIRSESYWPPSKYLNLHVLELQTFLGYASFPISNLDGINQKDDESIWDGVIVEPAYFGDNPSASAFPSFGRTATHEIGHYLGLRHIWGDGNCNVDDFVDDTPPADDDNGGLGSPCTFPSNDSNVCDTDEMFQNYMDYTDDGCMNLFTQGQKDRMRIVLENSPRRVSLLTSPGLVEPNRMMNDMAITQIVSPTPYECNSTSSPSIIVTNYGSNEVSSYDATISIDGMLIETINRSTSLSPNESEELIFSNQNLSSLPSIFSFSLLNINGVTDGNESNNSLSLEVEDGSSSFLPFTENFESEINLSNIPSNSWEVSTATKATTTNTALSFRAFQNNTSFGDSSIIKTPVFDLDGVNSAELSFSYSYAQTSSTFWDGLALLVSTDCGISFDDEFLFNSYGPELATSSTSEASYSPQSLSDWRDTTINITPFVNQSGVQFAFVGQNGGNNNIYIDDIAITQTNLNANDVSLVQANAPLVTCDPETSVSFQVRNVGFELITSLAYQYAINGKVSTGTIDGLALTSGNFQTISIDVPLNFGPSQVDFEITLINGNDDDDSSNNVSSVEVSRSSVFDSYPLLVNFEQPNFWNSFSPSMNAEMWNITTLNDNTALEVDAFNSGSIGEESWFISPILNVGNLDSAGLAFKVSYAERSGFNDQLRILMSVNCGESYPFELFNASSDSLAITESNTSWRPFSNDDWKEIQLDLKPSIVWNSDIRIAFVFTNGTGNNLYIDDINIGIKPENSNLNSYKVFPNPSHRVFNIAFQLEEQDDIEVQIIDVAGRIVYTQQFENVLDQVYNFDVLSEDGFYFVKIIGRRINQTERLYIRR